MAADIPSMRAPDRPLGRAHIGVWDPSRGWIPRDSCRPTNHEDPRQETPNAHAWGGLLQKCGRRRTSAGKKKRSGGHTRFGYRGRESEGGVIPHRLPGLQRSRYKPPEKERKGVEGGKKKTRNAAGRLSTSCPGQGRGVEETRADAIALSKFPCGIRGREMPVLTRVSSGSS